MPVNDIIFKQKILLTCLLSKTLALDGVRKLAPGRFPEVSKQGYHDGYSRNWLVLVVKLR